MEVSSACVGGSIPFNCTLRVNSFLGQGGSGVNRHFHLAIVGLCGGFLLTVTAQPPKPPALLPPSISGRPHEPVVPASGTAAKNSPLDRFQTPGYPADTLAALEAAKESTAWLTRMSKPDGRFVAAFDATLQRELPGSDLGQAMGCLAVARMAKFSGDEKTTALASQAVLALFTLTKTDPSDASMRVPNLTPDRGNKVGFAAVLATAVYDLPNPDAKLVAEADKLCRYLYTRLRDDGSVQNADGIEPAVQTDPDGVNRYPGLCFQALMASDRVKSEQWKRDALERGVKYYREVFKSKKTTDLCGSMLPAVCDYCLRMKSEAATAFSLEMADWLCDQQYTQADARNLRWVGGFRPSNGSEPTAQSSSCVQGMSAAITLTTQIPDAARFSRYRKAAIAGLTFTRSLQFNETNTLHFERNYRSALLGGVHVSASDGVLRVEHAGQNVMAQLRFLESGGERGE